MSLAAVNQICVIHEAMNHCKKFKDSLKDCFKDVYIYIYFFFFFFLRGGRCLFMEEGSFCLIGAAYPGSGAPMDKGRIPRDLFGIFWISLSIVISGQVFKR